MTSFAEYISNKLPNGTGHLHLERYPDIRSKLMHIINVVLYNPEYYKILQQFCQRTDTLKKYVSYNVEVSTSVVPYVSIFFLILI